MRAVKRLLYIALIISTATLLFSCNTEKKITPKNKVFYEYFDTVSIIYDYSGSSKESFDALCDRIDGEMREYHELYDIYNEYDGKTNLATLNRTAGNGPVKVDKKIIDMLLFAKEMYLFTDGKVNVAMGSVLKIWHEYREIGKEVPPMALLTEAAKHTDINSLVIDEGNMTVEILDPKMQLDVGAIAKGYATEMIASSLEAGGKSGCVLDIGGNLRTVGKKPDGTGWSAGVKNPNPSSTPTYVYKTTLMGDALVTSGSYERFYTVDGVRYHHIINGDTLMPENYYLSVSVKSDSSALSDALSTAIFNMQYEEAERFVSPLKNILVILVMPSGEVVTLGNE